MTLRTMLGIGWSIVTGLAGGWLVLMPWALNLQGGGDWTAVTKVSFGTGLGLLAFCLVGLVVTSLQIVRLVAPPRRARAAEPAAQQEHADQESLDRALLQLATKLVADLEAPAPAQTQPAGPEPAAASAPASSGAPAPNGISTRPQAPSSAPGGPTQEGPTSTGGGAPTWRRVDL